MQVASPSACIVLPERVLLAPLWGRLEEGSLSSEMWTVAASQQSRARSKTAHLSDLQAREWRVSGLYQVRLCLGVSAVSGVSGEVGDVCVENLGRRAVSPESQRAGAEPGASPEHLARRLIAIAAVFSVR